MLLGPPLLLVVHLFNDGPIIVHIHEQVLAPFGARLCIVAKHYTFELNAQRRLRSQQRHSCLRRRAITLAIITRHASRNYVHRGVITATRTRQDVIKRQLSYALLFTAVLATELVAHVNPQAPHARLLAAAANVDVSASANYRRHWPLSVSRTQHAIAVELFDEDRVLESHDDCARDTDGAKP